MYCYKLWETDHPTCTTGEPFYSCSVFYPVPIETREQLEDAIRMSDPLFAEFDFLYNKEYDLIPIKTSRYLWELFLDWFWDVEWEIENKLPCWVTDWIDYTSYKIKKIFKKKS